MTKTKISVHNKSVSQKEADMEAAIVTSVSEFSINSSVTSEYLRDNNEVPEIQVKLSAGDSFQSLNTFTSSDGGISSVDDSKCGTEMNLSGVHGGVTDMRSSAVNCSAVQNTALSLSGDSSQMAGIPRMASVICNRSNNGLVTETSAIVTVADQMTGSITLPMPMPNVTEQLMPVDNARHCGSVVQIRVFSTKLANFAAESVRIGRYDNIIDFHQDYCAFPVSQNSRNPGCFVPAAQSQITYYSKYRTSHSRDATVEEPAVGYAEAGVEQWVRQQNASRQKQEQMAASSVYASQGYRSRDEIAQSERYPYWSGHHNPACSVDLARTNMSSSDGLVRCSGYGNMDVGMNVHHFYHEYCKIPDDHLTVEQRQQRQNKMGRLQVIQQMITPEHQVPDECVDHMAGGSYLQSRGPQTINWNNVPYGDDVYAGTYNSGDQMMNSSAVMRHLSPAPRCDMMTADQRKWYHMQREHQMNKMGVQNNFYHCHPRDFYNSNIRYFEPQAPVNSPAVQGCQLSHAACDFTPVYPLCDPQACMCEGGMSSHMAKHHTLPSGMYGYAGVSSQPKCGCQQQMNRYDEFVNDRYCTPVSGIRQLTYDVSYKGQADGMQDWRTGEDIKRQQLMTAPLHDQFGVHSQQVTLTRQPNSSYCTDQNIVTEPVSVAVSYANVPLPTVAVRQRQPSNRKRKNNSNIAALPADSKSKKLDSDAGEWPSVVSAPRSGMLMNITSASLAHLAKGVENISAVMQQTVQQGGPFRYIQGQDDYADGSDENANFISAGNSLQVQSRAMLNPVEEKSTAASDCASVTLPLSSSFQASNRGTLSAVSTPSRVCSSTSTTGVDVVVVSKAPYTISYHPTGIASEGDSQDIVDVKNLPAAAFSHNARMVPQTYVEHHVSNVDTASAGHRHTASGEGFREENCAMACHKNSSDAAKVDRQQATATGSCLSMASSVAVIQPQMMSGTQLFIADRCSESTPVLNNFVLPTGILSTALKSPQHSHSMQHDTNYQGFAVQHASPSCSNLPAFCSPPETVKPNTDQLHSLVCMPNSIKSPGNSVSDGSPMSRCHAQSSIGGWHQASLSTGNRSFSQTRDVVQSALPGSVVITTQM